jgi:hypothetical protein
MLLFTYYCQIILALSDHIKWLRSTCCICNFEFVFLKDYLCVLLLLLQQINDRVETAINLTQIDQVVYDYLLKTFMSRQFVYGNHSVITISLFLYESDKISFHCCSLSFLESVN